LKYPIVAALKPFDDGPQICSGVLSGPVAWRISDWALYLAHTK
jgi:hypothetical protein